MADLAALSQRVLHDDGDFALVEASAVEMQKAMNAGVVTSVQLTQAYLDRIAAYDRTVVDTSETGRALASIIATSDVALEAAAASDAARAANGGPSQHARRHPGAAQGQLRHRRHAHHRRLRLLGGQPDRDDAAMVEGLRADGAIILGKASLDEFAFGFTSQFSAGSEPGDTVYVASPYATDQHRGRLQRRHRRRDRGQPRRDRLRHRHRRLDPGAVELQPARGQCVRRSAWPAATASCRSRSARTPAAR